MPHISTQSRHSQHPTKNTHFLHTTALLTLLSIYIFLPGCSTPSQNTPPKTTSQVVALINNHPITASDLFPHLAEAAGNQILNELILTHLLNTMATQSHWTISDIHIQNEIEALITTIDQSTTPTNTPHLIQTIRHQRGLGPNRFNALLRRNAILRKLITTDPALSSQTQSQIQSHIQSALTQLDTPHTAEHSEIIRHRATLVAEQLAMESLAQSLVDGAEVLVMDRSLKWSGE